MVNRLTRPIQAPSGYYDPRPVLPEGLPDIARSAGEELTGEIRAADRVAQIGAEFGDAIAKQEGQQAAQRDALSPDWRPSNDSSIRGRSYDATGIRTYENLLDSRLRTEFLNAQQEWAKDPNANPAALSARFDAITGRMGRDDVFDAIRGNFEASQSLLRLPFLRAAQDRFDERGRQNVLASSSDADTQSREVQARAGQAAPGPETDQLIAEERARQVARAEADFNEGRITAGQRRQRLDAASASAIEAQWGPRVQRAVTPEELQRVQQEATEARDAGRLPAAGFAAVDGAIQTRQRQLLTGGRAALNEATRAGGAHNDQMRTENPPSDAAAAAVAGQFPATPEGERARALFNAQRSIISQMRGQTEEQGQAIAETWSRTSTEAGNPASIAGLAQFARDEQARRATALRQDMLGLARADGLTVSSLGIADFAAMPNGNPDQLAQSFGRRVSEAEAIARQYGRAPQFFTAEERARIGEVLELPGDKQLGLITALVRGAGSQSRQAFAEISTRAPTLAQAGAIMAANPNDPQARATAMDMLEGVAAARVQGAARPTLPAKRQAEIVNTVLGTRSIGMDQAEVNRISVAAYHIAQTRAARQGVSLENNDGLFDRALREAAGAVFVNNVQYGGPAPYWPLNGWFGGRFGAQSIDIVAPSNVRADRFGEVIGALRQSDIDALPEAQRPATAAGRASLRDIQAAAPIVTRGGYQFEQIMSDGQRRRMTTADGRPFVLPWTPELEGQLRSRVPGAFR